MVKTESAGASFRGAIRILVAGSVVALSVFLMVRSVRAGLAYSLYFHSKYGGDKENLDRILRDNVRAWRLYPYNAYSCIWVAQQAYGHALDSSGGDRTRLLDVSRLWCERGSLLNPYDRDLQWLRTELLRADDLQAAIHNWEAFVEWQYWEPANHIVLADLYAEAGQVEKVREVLSRLKGFPREQAHVQRLLDTASSKSGPGPER